MYYCTYMYCVYSKNGKQYLLKPKLLYKHNRYSQSFSRIALNWRKCLQDGARSEIRNCLKFSLEKIWILYELPNDWIYVQCIAGSNLRKKIDNGRFEWERNSTKEIKFTITIFGARRILNWSAAADGTFHSFSYFFGGRFRRDSFFIPAKYHWNYMYVSVCQK